MLVAGEYLSLSFLIDLTGRPEVARWAALYRLAAPVAIGAAAAGWVVSRPAPGAQRPAGDDPPWRPWAPLAGNLAAFSAALALAWWAFGPAASRPAATWALPVLAGLGALAVSLAALSAGPPAWLAARARRLGGLLPLALAAGLAAWAVTSSVEGAWGLLSHATLHAVAGLLSLSEGNVLLIPDELAVGLDGFEVEIAPVCSGADGIGLFLLFGAIWLAQARARLRFPVALAVLPVGAAIAFAANAVRIAALVRVGAAGHEAVALGGLHSKLGWILFVALALGTIALLERVPWLHRSPPPEADVAAEAGDATPYLTPLLAAISVALLTGAWAPGPIDPWYAARIVAAGAALAATRARLPPLRPTRSALPALLGLAVGAGWVLAATGNDAGPAAALDELTPPGRLAWVALRVLGSILVIPLAEELAFRGWLLRWLSSRDFEAVPPRAWTWTALILSSLAFGAVHARLLAGTLAGLCFALAYRWRGRLGDAAVAHAAANAVVAAAVLAGGRWALW